MANCTIILGASGTGKSTSIKGLDPKETFIINVLGKQLPFKGSKKIYSEANKNCYQLSDSYNVCKFLDGIKDRLPNIRNVIIDDAIYIMRKEHFNRAKETSFNKFTDYAVHFQNVIQACELLREDINVFLILHPEEVVSDGTIKTYQVATVGKMLSNQYNPMECVPMVLFSGIQYDETGKACYGFYTNRCMSGSVEIPAKSPAGMFDDIFIINDLGYVVNKMNEYYGEGEAPQVETAVTPDDGKLI